MNLFHLVGPSPFWVHVMITKYSTSFIRSPIIETAIPTTMAYHTTISTYWYKTCWLSSHTNLYLLITPVFMSLADSWTSHNPNVGNNAFPGLGEWRTPEESMNVALKNIPNELSEYGTLSMRHCFWPESIVKRVSILKPKSFVAIIHFEMWKITSKSFAKEWLFKSLAVASSIGSARGSKKIFLSCPRRLINTFPCAQNSCLNSSKNQIELFPKCTISHRS